MAETAATIEVPSVYIRLCLFTITIFCFENEAVKKDFSCLALHSVIQNKMLQHSYTVSGEPRNKGTPFLLPIMLYLNTQLSKVLFVCTALSNSLPPQSHKDTILEQKLRADTGLLQAHPELLVSLNCILNIFPPLLPSYRYRIHNNAKHTQLARHMTLMIS